MKLNFKKMFRKAGKEKGQSLAEYGLILALVSVVCIGSLTSLGTAIDGKISAVAGAIGG